MKLSVLINRKFIFWTATVLFVLISITQFWAVNAQEASGNGLRITPVRQELVLAAGQADEYEIEVTNVTGGPTTVTTYVNDFASNNETGQPMLVTNDDNSNPNPYSLKKYVSIPEPFDLKAGESKEVTIKVSLSEEMGPGGYFGAIRFLAGSGEADGETAISLAASVASLLFVNVPGATEEGMTIDFMSAVKGDKRSSFFETSPDKIAVKMSNTGNTTLKPFGKVVIKDMFGNSIKEYEFNSGQLRGNVLPKSSRIFENSIDKVGFFGRYTIEANLSYGEGGGNILNSNATFWVVPWKILLALVAVIGLLVWFLTRGLKMYNRKVVERAKRNS